MALYSNILHILVQKYFYETEIFSREHRNLFLAMDRVSGDLKALKYRKNLDIQI